ncbi:hypothetical protein ACE6H2_012232 [Prunus campanulata]
MSDPLKPFFERLVKFYGLIQEPEVAGAYNDLHLCYAGEYHERNYYICNPFTQQCNNNITDAAKDNNPNNIAQLNTNYRCKVVRLISPRHGIESSKFKVQIFSSETGEWKESIVSSPQDIFLFSLKSNICDFFQVVVPWWPTPVPILQQHAHAQPRTKNHQNQLEEEMGKFMEGAAPDEEDVKVRVAKKPRTHY